MDWPLLLTVASTWALVGLVWIVQLVQYPLFALVGTEAFPNYHRCHARQITYVVAPLMAVELATALWLVGVPPSGVAPAALWASLGLVGVNWLSTAFVQVPLHGRLSGGVQPALVRRLVRTNWVRTIAWTARGVLVLTWLAPSGT